ncbi:CRISPR-associated protein Cas2 [Desulfurella amilsii]|uniref:CRISPR-associated endoribonuclease Cas2 n=1 Tax=Desulfurella amilsii TaxID=1562698 RepID=A0A1X4XVE8_9BACT|nr:CRISPR-associated endonuclease Cas2 [Desulfurella amilsii]OSS41507.1 CRISPR-associated protein Cas2 [Desulfurella amilsii]
MYIIAVYDICTIDSAGQTRLVKTMKTFRKYLHHTQKSVFEGELSESKFKSLIIEVKKNINDKEDYLIFYRIDNKNNCKRECFGKDNERINTII